MVSDVSLQFSGVLGRKSQIPHHLAPLALNKLNKRHSGGRDGDKEMWRNTNAWEEGRKGKTKEVEVGGGRKEKLKNAWRRVKEMVSRTF